MTEYNSHRNTEIFQQLKESEVISLKGSKTFNLIELIYFLITKRFRGFIVDDYLFPISNKTTLIEAIYYQVGLIDMYDLNWDALQEVLERYVHPTTGKFVVIDNVTEELLQVGGEGFKW